MKTVRIAGTAVALLGMAWTSGVVGQGTPLPARVVPVVVVPRDLPLDAQRLPLDIAAVADVRAWYARALDGPTFTADPLLVRKSRHTFAELADSNFQAWWPLLQTEFTDLGVPWQGPDAVKLLLLVQGAGAWAGAESENDGLTRPGDAGHIPGGNRGGFVIIGDSSAGGMLTGACPTDGIQRGTAWWCNWDTYRGTIAHELGHTWGLPHPDGIRPDTSAGRWDCDRDGNTVLQCHWNFPYDSLLTYERTHLRSLRFFTEASEPRYTLLTEVLPTRRTGDVEIRRPAVTPAADAEPVVWVYDATGFGATGYVWAVVLPAGTAVEWWLAPGCRQLALAVGRAHTAGGSGQVAIAVGPDTVWAGAVAAGAHDVSAPVCGPGTLVASATGPGRFRAVLGNPRLYP